MIEADLESSGELKKYRHLRKNIDVVRGMSVGKGMKTYSADPLEFERLLVSSV